MAPPLPTTTAATDGTYSFSGLSAGTYAVTPSATGFGFNPTTQAAVISSSDITGVNFVAAAQSGPTFSLSGTISPASAGSGASGRLERPSRRDGDSEFLRRLFVPRTFERRVLGHTKQIGILVRPRLTKRHGERCQRHRRKFHGHSGFAAASHGFAEMDGEHFNGEGLQRLSKHGNAAASCN